MTMQTLVIAHAAFGHNHFFKNNYLFRQWTDADGILDYLEFAKTLHRRTARSATASRRSSALLDAAHALMGQGVHRYPAQARPRPAPRRSARASGASTSEQVFNDLWRTVPKGRRAQGATSRAERTPPRAARAAAGEPALFPGEDAPRLEPWQREMLRIVRQIAQYFYPQSQTKVMNEGCATYVHYRIMNRLHEKGQITDGAFLEFLHSPHQRGVPAGLRRPALLRHQSLRARLRR